MLLVAVAVCVTVAWVVAQAPAVTALAVALLTIGLYATALGAIATSTASQRPPQGAPGADVYRFSTRENVLVVLLDGLESSIAGDILERSPSIAHAFDGFQYFPDTAGVARTTFLSLPAIHSGAIYSPSRSTSAYFADEIRRRSFMNRFAAAGFDSILLNPVESPYLLNDDLYAEPHLPSRRAGRTDQDIADSRQALQRLRVEAGVLAPADCGQAGGV